MADDEVTMEKVLADPANREELIGWLDIIHNQVYDLVMNQFMFNSVWKVIEDNPELQKRPSHFYGWFRGLYAQAMAMAIRRLCDNDPRAVSLVRFLAFVKKDPSVVSRETYASLFPADTINHPGLPTEVKSMMRERMINQGYDTTVGEGVLQPRGKDLGKEIAELKCLADEILEYATKRIAHFDKEPPSVEPTLEAINTVIDHASEIVQKYVLLLKAISTEMGVHFQYDWLAPFRVAWIPEAEWFKRLKESQPDLVASADANSPSS
jgi:hypothetical protein